MHFGGDEHLSANDFDMSYSDSQNLVQWKVVFETSSFLEIELGLENDNALLQN